MIGKPQVLAASSPTQIQFSIFNFKFLVMVGKPQALAASPPTQIQFLIFIFQFSIGGDGWQATSLGGLLSHTISTFNF